MNKSSIMKENEKVWKKLPTHLIHTPICSVDFQDFKARFPDREQETEIDTDDVKYYSIGFASWHAEQSQSEGKYSMKIFRTYMDDDNYWSRQAEELPLWRVLNMTLVYLAVIYEDPSIFKEDGSDKRSHKVIVRDGYGQYLKEIKETLSYKENKEVLREIKRILNRQKDL